MTLRVKRSLSFDDYIALRYLECGSSTATHHVARTLGYDRVHGGTATPKARNLLRRLARWGLVQGESAMGDTTIRWWRITDAGREAVER